MLDTLLLGVTERRRFARWLIPLVRSYIRYVPWAAGKRSFWTRVVEPYFAWHSHPFVARTVFGKRVAGNTRDMVQQYLYYFGVWEPDLTRWIARRLSPGDTFVDVGANIGYYSLLASQRVGSSGSVVAVEASPAIFRALEENLRRNRTRNVRAVNLAAADAPGRVRLFHGPAFNSGETSTLQAPGCEFEGEVQAAPLAAILTPEEIRAARCIKIDVEGAECSVVAGMEPLLRSGRADLEVIVEVHPEQLAKQGKQPEELITVFAEAGFTPYRLPNDYWAVSYLAPPPAARPARLRAPVEEETVLVFSRREAEAL